MAKEVGFYLETPNGEEHYAIPMLERFAERVLANADVDNLKADIDTYVKISSEQAKVICDLEDKLKIAVDALRADCGNRCNAENNPCASRIALEKISK